MKKYLVLIFLILVISIFLTSCDEVYELKDRNVIVYELVSELMIYTDKNILCVRYDIDPHIFKDAYVTECFRFERLN